MTPRRRLPATPGTPRFLIELSDSSRTRIAVAGEIDLVTGPLVEAAIDCTILGANGWVEVDLSDVTFIDSTGVAALVAAQRRLREHGSDLRLHRPSPAVARLIDLLGLTFPGAGG